MDTKKIKKILLIIISILISISIVLIAYNKIMKVISEKKIAITAESINEVIESGIVVKDYSNFYTLNSACKNYMTFLFEKNPGKTYSVFTKKLKSEMKYDTYKNKIRDFANEYLVTDNLDNIYDAENCLHKAYIYDKIDNVTNLYLCQIKTLKEDKYLNVVVKLIKSGKPRYEILYIGI